MTSRTIPKGKTYCDIHCYVKAPDLPIHAPFCAKRPEGENPGLHRYDEDGVCECGSQAGDSTNTCAYFAIFRNA